MNHSDKKENTSLIRTAAAFFGVLFLAGILFLCIDLWCFDKDFYDREYSKLNTASDIGITEDSLKDATDALIDYLKDRRDDLIVTGEFLEHNAVYRPEGENEIYNGREKLHMADVRDLYRTGGTILYAGLVSAIAAYVFLFLFSRKKGTMKQVLKGYTDANLILLAFASVILVFCLIDFDTFWTGFHKVFFRNDLWLLDPRECVLINMVPEQFFFDLVTGIAVTFISVALALFIAAAVMKRRLSGEEKK